MSVFSTERPVPVEELRALKEQKAAEYKANKQLMEAQRILEEQEAKMQEEMARQDAEQKEREAKERAMEAATQAMQESLANKAYTTAFATLPKVGKESLVKHTLFGIALESMWVDDCVKESPEFIPQTFSLFEQVIDRCNAATGTTLLENMENTRLLSYISDVATESANEIAGRILAEAKETKPLTIDFKPTENEVAAVDEKIADADPKSISKVVKSKVLDIIKEEKEDGKLKAELFQELDDATKEEEEGEESGDIVESMIGISMDKVLEAIDIRAEDTPVIEHMANKMATLVSLADRECVAGNKEKAIACYEQVSNLVGEANAISRYQDRTFVNEAAGMINDAVSSRLFEIRPGTRKAIRCESVAPVSAPSFQVAGKILKTYCEDMTRAIFNGNILTETVEQVRSRLIREHASRKLHSAIGSSVFESMMIQNMVNVRGAVTESGTSMLDSEIQNAAFLQSVVEYTLLETLNTMQVYKLNKDAISKLKRA